MRIACIASSTIPSRTANSIQVMKVCQALIDLGHEVHLWVPGKNPQVAWSDLATHYGVQDQFEINWLAAAKALRRYDFCCRAVRGARHWKPDLYYVWPYQAAALASRLGLPCILEVHDRPQGRFGPFLFRQFLNGSGARRMLPTTRALRSYLSEAYELSLEPPFTVVASNGVDLEQYRDLPEPEEARRKLGIHAAFAAGYTGHLYPGRGVGLLLKLAKSNPAVDFLWAGGEPAAIEYWRQQLKIENAENVHLMGFVPNDRLPFIQAACDVLLMPYERRISVSSGGDTAQFASPMKVFDYLAAGRVILSSDLPVLREVLNSSNAVLLPPEKFQPWNDALRLVAADSEYRERLSNKACQDAVQYSWLNRARRSLAGLEVVDGK
jgi:glycosyltransferase involved in cell wall biosynthesis